MLTIYRRHMVDCPHRGEGRKYRRCRCPIWMDGTLDGQEIRESLKTQNWEKAQEKLRAKEANPDADLNPEPPLSIADACQQFTEDAEARNLSPATVYKYRLLFRDLRAFADGAGLRFLEDLDLAALRKFRAAWPDANLSALKKLERLRAFFRFAHEAGWLAENPAKRIKNPKVNESPTMPYTQEEMVQILSACEKYPDNYGQTGKPNARRLRALILLLRYSGLRIRDAITLPCDKITGGKLFLYTQKTGVPVYCPIPDFVSDALFSCERTNQSYFFWTGESNPKSAVGDWQRSLRKLFTLAGVPDGHAHRFRDTFAVELLLSGVPLERVSILLGHRSTKVTERHYSPWVRARQEQLEADVKRSWATDPIALGETKGTPEVHGGSGVVN